MSTDDQDAGRQRDSIEAAYGEHNLNWYCDLGVSGVKTGREQYQQMRERIDQYDVVVAHELDRLGRSFAELAELATELSEKGIGIDLVNQPISTVGEGDWMQEMMLNMMMVFADAERRMIQSRVQEGIDRALEQGKHVGRPPFGYTVEEGFLQQVPDEYVRARKFIEEVKRGREKKATTRWFEIPESSVQSILKRAEENYDIFFDNDQWQVERAKVKAGEKKLSPLSEV